MNTELHTGEIVLPAGKTLSINRERFRVTVDSNISADVLEPVKKQATAMRKLSCPTCGTVLRGTRKYKNRIVICGGEINAPHEGAFFVWTDDAPVTEPVEE